MVISLVASRLVTAAVVGGALQNGHESVSQCCVLGESRRVKHERVNSVDLFD